MPIKVILSSTLRKYVPGYDPIKGLEMEVEEGTTLKDVMVRLKIPEKDIKIAMVNGVRVRLNKKLEGNERIGLFPAVGGG
ncbi:MAG: thiamine biosynthesis protein ThiS [Deltaproteobacteria bacterium]|nr:MAG: thiamine biosynthesis protein ThiS [Deltaproteobacteria bacterium]